MRSGNPLTTLYSSLPTCPVWRESLLAHCFSKILSKPVNHPISISSLPCKILASAYSLVIVIHGCPMSGISIYAFPFTQSIKDSNPLTRGKKRIKDTVVNFPCENILNFHTLLQVVCHSIVSSVSDTFLSFVLKNTFPKLLCLLVQPMRDNAGRLKSRREREK